MHRSCVSFLLVFALCFTGLNGIAAPVIQNASFEDSVSLIWPGWTSIHNFPADSPLNGTPIATGIPGWTSFKVVGLNPIQGITNRTGDQTVDFQIDTGLNPLANNGITPDGRNVLFLQNGGRVSQNVAGFEGSKIYVLHFFCNARSDYSAPDLHVRLNGNEIGNFQPAPVNASWQRTNPYHFLTTDVFIPENSGSFLLELIDMNEATDNAVLIDKISIEEMSPLRLVSAVRDESDVTKVGVTFSSNVPTGAGNNALKYSIQSSAGMLTVQEAVVGTDGKTVTLITDPIDDPEGEYKLILVDFVDNEGRRLLKDNSEIPIAVPDLPDPELTIEAREERLFLTWPRKGYASYRLQWSANLAMDSWTDITAVMENGDRFEYEELNTDEPNKYFRLIK